MKNNQVIFKKKPYLFGEYKGSFPDEEDYRKYKDAENKEVQFYYIDKNYNRILSEESETIRDLAIRIINEKEELKELFEKSVERFPEIFLLKQGYFQCRLSKSTKEVDIRYSGNSNDEDYINNIINKHKIIRHIDYNVVAIDIDHESNLERE